MGNAKVSKDQHQDEPGQDAVIALADGAVMPAYLALPRSGSGPGVLIISDEYGRSPFYDNLARKLADLGYVALCPAPFHRQAPLRRRDAEDVRERWAAGNEVDMLSDLDASLDWLAARSDVTEGRLAVMGFRMGGTFALNLAATRRDVATCCFYGFPAGSPTSGVKGPSPLDVVDDMAGPVIGFWGENDTAVTMDSVQQLVEALDGRGVEFHCLTYPGVGEGFMAEERPDDRTADAARHAWVRVTAFLRRHVVNV